MPELLKSTASWKVLVGAFVLTVTTRIGLQTLTDVPLSPGATAVIAGLWLIVCILLRWLWQKRSRIDKGVHRRAAKAQVLFLVALSSTAPASAQTDGLCIAFEPGSAESSQIPDFAEAEIRDLSRHVELRWVVSGSAGVSETSTVVPGLLLAQRRAQAIVKQISRLGVSEAAITTDVTLERPPDCGVLVRILDPSGRPVPFARGPSAAPGDGPPVIVDREPERLRATGRDYLVSGRKEDPGFGLYTYLLFPKKPASGDAVEQARLRSALEGFLRVQTLADVEETVRHFEGNVDRTQLNIWYLPVRAVPEMQNAEALLESYNWAAAGFFLGRADQPEIVSGRGPYLVSSRVPLSNPKLQRAALIQDLSRVPGGPLMVRWLDLYMRKAQEPRRWGDTNLQEHALRVQTELENLVPELKAAKDAIATVLLGWREVFGGGGTRD